MYKRNLITAESRVGTSSIFSFFSLTVIQALDLWVQLNTPPSTTEDGVADIDQVKHKCYDKLIKTEPEFCWLKSG